MPIMEASNCSSGAQGGALLPPRGTQPELQLLPSAPTLTLVQEAAAEWPCFVLQGGASQQFLFPVFVPCP